MDIQITKVESNRANLKNEVEIKQDPTLVRYELTIPTTRIEKVSLADIAKQRQVTQDDYDTKMAHLQALEDAINNQ